MRIVVVGAGMAGLACAGRLNEAGHLVTVLDKGRVPGGRMSTRRLATDLGEAAFDHGAQYFTVSDPRFEAQVRRWRDTATVAPWPAAGEGAWVGTPAMNAPVKVMAEGLDVLWEREVVRLARHAAGWEVVSGGGEAVRCGQLVMALPAEQAGSLLADVVPQWSVQARANPSLPCWTVMLVLSEPVSGLLPDCLRGDHNAVLGWAARNTAKPDRTGPESWVLQAGSQWSAEMLEAPKHQIENALIEAFRARLGMDLPEVVKMTSHRWRFARPGNHGSGPLWDGERGLGVCGDWLSAPTVEGAWVSGYELGNEILSGSSVR